MKKRSLSLNQLKVKSFVTTVDKSHQIAAKGGATYDEEFDSCVLDEVIIESENTKSVLPCPGMSRKGICGQQ